MQIRPYVLQVQGQVAAAAALGDDSARNVADALATAAEPAVRLALLSAVSAAADEITAALLDAPGAPAVSVHIDGDDLRVDVRTVEFPEAAAEPVGAGIDDADNTGRISLRLPEPLKAKIEVAARSSGMSVNTWLLRAAAAALSESGPPRRGNHGSAARVTGWINP